MSAPKLLVECTNSIAQPHSIWTLSSIKCFYNRDLGTGLNDGLCEQSCINLKLTGDTEFPPAPSNKLYAKKEGHI